MSLMKVTGLLTGLLLNALKGAHAVDGQPVPIQLSQQQLISGDPSVDDGLQVTEGTKVNGHVDDQKTNRDVTFLQSEAQGLRDYFSKVLFGTDLLDKDRDEEFSSRVKALAFKLVADDSIESSSMKAIAGNIEVDINRSIEMYIDAVSIEYEQTRKGTTVKGYHGEMAAQRRNLITVMRLQMSSLYSNPGKDGIDAFIVAAIEKRLRPPGKAYNELTGQNNKGFLLPPPDSSDKANNEEGDAEGGTKDDSKDSTENTPTGAPTGAPTVSPTEQPTGAPTGAPTKEPTGAPTKEPTGEPTGAPTKEPTGEPTSAPTKEPTGEPTGAPTKEPTGEPTGSPTKEPTGEPTGAPTGAPTEQPTGAPTGAPTEQPTGAPTEQPTGAPTGAPTKKPTSRNDDETDKPYVSKAGIVGGSGLVIGAAVAGQALRGRRKTKRVTPPRLLGLVEKEVDNIIRRKPDGKYMASRLQHANRLKTTFKSHPRLISDFIKLSYGIPLVARIVRLGLSALALHLVDITISILFSPTTETISSSAKRRVDSMRTERKKQEEETKENVSSIKSGKGKDTGSGKGGGGTPIRPR